MMASLSLVPHCSNLKWGLFILISSFMLKAINMQVLKLRLKTYQDSKTPTCNCIKDRVDVKKTIKHNQKSFKKKLRK